MIRILIPALVLMVASSVASADQGLSSKELGFLLDVVSATDTSGAPVAKYLTTMATLGDKWDIRASYSKVTQDGRYEDVIEIYNNGCGMTRPTTSPCRKAALLVKVEGRIGGAATYQTDFSEVPGTR